MTWSKKKTIIAFIITISGSIIVPMIFKIMDIKKKEETYKTNKIIIEQKAIFPGGGGGDYTIDKTIRIRENTN